MSKNYVDYTNQVIVTVPEHFINTITGDIQYVTPDIEEQLQYHTNNNTLSHLLFSALSYYVQNNSSTVPQKDTSNIMNELLEIKRMIQNNSKVISTPATIKSDMDKKELNIKEVEDVLEAFGG